eukprot:4025767-Alexandrium_andersonii.AAC.1
MSASLVGSEMCIRDSPSPPRSARSSSRAFVLPPIWLSRQPRGTVVVVNPVSYTHLTLPTICSV